MHCLPDCWLEGSMNPEGPATGHLNTAENCLVDDKVDNWPVFLCVIRRTL